MTFWQIIVTAYCVTGTIIMWRDAPHEIAAIVYEEPTAGFGSIFLSAFLAVLLWPIDLGE